jgi:hypothetical protein
LAEFKIIKQFRQFFRRRATKFRSLSSPCSCRDSMLWSFTIFCDFFYNFRRKNRAKTGSIFCQFFGENIFKIIMSVPDRRFFHFFKKKLPHYTLAAFSNLLGGKLRWYHYVNPAAKAPMKNLYVLPS